MAVLDHRSHAVLAQSMNECIWVGCAWLVALSTWLTPMPPLSKGLIVAYGSDSLMSDQFDFRGYTQQGLYHGCGIAVMSPVHIGEIAWIRTTGPWIGPCGITEVVAQRHMYRAVFILGEIAEVSDLVRKRLGFVNGAQGEMWIGACPPMDDWTLARAYKPPLHWSQPGEVRPNFWPQPIQEWPQHCSELDWK